ncbi:hypothetical protein LINPERPRIM_LOCUS36223 [Linum perenne]
MILSTFENYGINLSAKKFADRRSSSSFPATRIRSFYFPFPFSNAASLTSGEGINSLISMSSTPKKRPKHGSKSQKLSPSPSSSSPSIMEPPGFLFPSRQELTTLFTVVAIASAVAFTCNLIATYSNPASKPFCDGSIDPDSCEPCPVNGECREGELVCDQGYRRKGNLCLEDGDSNERAKKLVRSMILFSSIWYTTLISELLESYICESYAQFSCYGTGRIWVHESEMWEDVHDQVMRIFGQDNASYSYAKNKSMETIGILMERKTNSEGIAELKCPSALAELYKPIDCRVHEWIFEHAFVLVAACTMVVALMWLIRKIRQRFYVSNRSEELYDQVCDMLEENAINSKGGSSEFEPWVVASQLRDHLLLPRERKDPLLWKKVEELVQEDSRIDRYPKLVKGESKVVWEWQVEGCLSSAGKKSKERVTKLRSNPSPKAYPNLETHKSQSGRKLPLF